MGRVIPMGDSEKKNIEITIIDHENRKDCPIMDKLIVDHDNIYINENPL